jgi:hypothetical protein
MIGKIAEVAFGIGLLIMAVVSLDIQPYLVPACIVGGGYSLYDGIRRLRKK